ncbi:MAG: peptidylprolyl isomerase [bacterium]
MKSIFTAIVIIITSLNIGGETLVNKITATVDGSPITLFDLKKIVNPANPEIVKPEDIKDRENEIIEQAVQHQVIKKAVKELNITVTEPDLNEALKRVAQQNGNISVDELKSKIESEGISWEKYRDEVLREQLEIMQLKKHVAFKNLDVDESDLRELYKQHYKETELMNLSRIVIPVETDEDSDSQKLISNLRNKILNGETSFEEAARKYSKGENAESGGLIGDVSVDEMNRTVTGHIKNLEEGDISEPLTFQDARQIFKLNSRKTKEPPDYNSVADRLRHMYYVQNMDKAFENWLNLRIQKSRVKKFSL